VELGESSRRVKLLESVKVVVRLRVMEECGQRKKYSLCNEERVV
jgi:hypothetical protein